MELVQQIVAFHTRHNAEPEAIDLLMEVEDLDLLVEHVDRTNFKRACLYLISLARLVPGPDDMFDLDIAFMINLKFEEYPNALLIALFLDNKEGSSFELNDEMVSEDEEREAMQDIINNAKLSEGYLTLARDIVVMEAKTPEDIYKVLNVSFHFIDLTLDAYFKICCCDDIPS